MADSFSRPAFDPQATDDVNSHSSQAVSEDRQLPAHSGRSPQVPHPPMPQRHLLRAYENDTWLKSRDARLIRILSEFMEPQGRLRQNQILGSIVFFGSARLKSPQQWTEEFDKWTALANDSATSEEARTQADSKLQLLARQKHLSFEFYDKIALLAQLVTEWAQTPEASDACRRLVANVPECPRNFFSSFPASHSAETPRVEQESRLRSDGSSASYTRSGLAVCTGGGPGMMEAANKGAAQVAGGRSMGMGVTLPFESDLNSYVEPSLAFQYHYFFTRKFWMVYMAMGVVAAPGGVGTLDELMEILTLRQTGRFKKCIPIVLFGKDFWRTVLNLDFLYDNGLISDKDREMLLWTDDPHEAFEFIRTCMTRGDAYPGPKQFRR
eukprot:Gregarina_sp_Pseudo_9__2120@NODE_247_length_3444_cov_52_284581_g230_i0_p1_GENE_NODE_247_length_3444_cov_52_284581_g230_i0NODE_247_length_3444_cov_52_284581_g230_i0_p1_ORF_typecomplete_len382_score44_45Lysine_decarbox/PF03641_14/1_3e26LDcluster4/PF18306_1/2_3e14SpoIIIAH/PF12685_7/0_013TipAS/PF07739_13/0_24_NODE_247_length_3444_cov_52_284581_g230_i021363281